MEALTSISITRASLEKERIKWLVLREYNSIYSLLLHQAKAEQVEIFEGRPRIAEEPPQGLLIIVDRARRGAVCFGSSFFGLGRFLLCRRGDFAEGYGAVLVEDHFNVT